MAIAAVANRVQFANAAAASNVVVTLATGASIAVGNHLIMVVTADNAGAAGSSPFLGVSIADPTVTDLQGNTWVVLSNANRTPGAAPNDGTSQVVLMTFVQFPYFNGATVSFAWSGGAAANRIVQIHEFSGIRKTNTVPGLSVDVGPSTTTGGTNTVATASMSPLTAGQLVFAAGSFEAGSASLGNDADGIEGAWAATTNQFIGVGATGQTQGYSYKVTSGVAAQQWNSLINTGVAGDWASNIFVLAADVNAAEPFIRGNPNYPCLAGFEGLPLKSTTVPVDTGTVYQIQHKLTLDSYLTDDYTVTAEFAQPPANSQHTVAFDLYAAGNENTNDTIVTVTLPLRRVDLGGTAVVSGGGTALDALSIPNGSFIQFDTGPGISFVSLWFDPTLLNGYLNSRVVRWGLRYKGWKQDTSPADPGEGFDANWRDTFGGTRTFLHGSWLMNDYRSEAQYQTRWMGETNAIFRGGNASQDWWRMPFAVEDLSHMDAADQTAFVLFQARPGFAPFAALQTIVNLDHMEMVVELVPERRTAVANRFVSNVTDTSVPVDGLNFTYAKSVEVRYSLDTSTEVALTGVDYVLAVREALPPSPSDRYRVTVDGAAQFSGGEAVGPSLQMKAFTQPRATLEPLQIVDRGTLNGGVLIGEPTDFDQYTLSVVGYDSVLYGSTGSFWTAYDGLSVEEDMQVHSGLIQIMIIRAGAATTYDKVKVLVKPDALTTQNLDIDIKTSPGGVLLSQATITVADALAAPEVGEGWHEVSVSLGAPAFTITPGNVELRIEFDSPAQAPLAPWRVASAHPTGGRAAFGYYPSPLVGGNDDMAFVLQCTLADPVVVMSTTTTEIVRAESHCLAPSLEMPTLTISNWALFDRFVIERFTGFFFDSETIFVGSLDDTAGVFVDTAPPWDLPLVGYGVTGYRDSDRRSTFASDFFPGAPMTAPGVAFGLVGGDIALAYVPVTEGGALDVTWNPLSPIDTVQRHAQDFQVALRAPEYRGMSVTVTVVVDHFASCQIGLETAEELWNESITPGTQSFSPMPFFQLQRLEAMSRIALQLPGGHTRWVSLDISSGMKIRTSAGLYLAEITLTDVAPPSSDPYEGM